ncbi:hypothetical protein [Nisaea sp.]|uniref:hypothetical protein n=1 Tax=Nisaea sp. TaxID=2024842 RepID=UPI003B52E2D0
MNFVRVGTLDDPDAHIFTTIKLSRVRIPETVPDFPDFYNPADVWQKESLARMQALRGRF